MYSKKQKTMSATDSGIFIKMPLTHAAHCNKTSVILRHLHIWLQNFMVRRAIKRFLRHRNFPFIKVKPHH